MSSASIRKELQLFQASVKKLGAGVGAASALWRDQKFAELSASVAQVADQSKHVMVTGDRVCSSIDRFDSIAAEKY